MKNILQMTGVTLLGLSAMACSPKTDNQKIAAFADTEWTVQSIDGNPAIETAKPTIRFGSDYKLSGSATCNRMLGTYKMEGREIDIEPTGTTMMNCAPAENMQERVFLDILDDVEYISVTEGGELHLRTDDGEVIIATK